ncbi:glycoside hydrolase family 1 protein [Vibrio renipiscarius]|uniref:6-phospho-beta-glucosidase n=1 Tax=Vibrio renipiscarius TaxID=1461322 RepID=A0A0C2NMP3_9VIBR|nr:glycoside hydrolase family 1 protein [Vibrio renipiscarius]KII75312.1 6-phospho-beta-glucosidase [Vibrio renipiscarius]KII78764.1 6-phospho-beta-glucosidase [Vibrio renipiscarius]
MTKYVFPKDFKWGAAASGIQTEGRTNKANDSIWDLWHRESPERFFRGIGSDKVTDTYHRYEEDVQLMKKVGFNSFRTSIQWSRLIKDYETGEVCQDAVQFYNNYLDEMITNGIEPMMNLYHFDMPAELQKKYGGFESKKVVDLYVDYAVKAFQIFGNKVKYWITFNEPIVPVEGGYLYDFHYPCKKDGKLAVQVGYNIILAHAKAVKEFHKLELKESKIGVVLNLTPSYTRDEREEDKKAAWYADLLFNRSFLDPMVKNEIPQELCEIFAEHGVTPETTSEEIDYITSAKIDFLGVNYYVPRRVKAREVAYDLDYFTPEYYFENYINPEGRFNPYRDNNEILPTAIHDIAINVKDNYGNIPWFLAEIGIAMDEESEGKPGSDGIIDDTFRTDLMKEHLIQLHRALEDGANCFGVHQWTFIDNWSWTNSFKRRYGFYRLDLETGNRIPKKHGLWFKELSISGSFNV